MRDVTAQIKRRIHDKNRGWVFLPKDFADLGTRAAVDQVLCRLVKQGMIRRLDRGIYDYPKKHSAMGTLSPGSDDLAKVLAGKTGDTVFPSGAMAANLLGLSTQVPAKPTYLTNGASRSRTIAGRTIRLKHARVPIMNALSDQANFTLQALSYLGKNSINQDTIQRCANHLDDQDIQRISTVMGQLPGWLADTMFKIQQVKYGQLRA